MKYREGFFFMFIMLKDFMHFTEGLNKIYYFPLSNLFFIYLISKNQEVYFSPKLLYNNSAQFVFKYK